MADRKPIVFDTTDNVYAQLLIDGSGTPDTLLTKDIQLDDGQLRLNQSHREAIQFSRLYSQGPTTQGISWGQIKPDGSFERQWELMKNNSYDFVINQTGNQITGLGTDGTAADSNEAFRIKYNNNLATFGGDIKIKGDRITVHTSGNTYDHKLDFTTPTDHRTITFQDGSGTVAFLSDAPATNLSYTASTRLLESSTGTDVTLPEVVAGGNSGLITGADKTKIDGIEAGATGDQTAAEIRTLVDSASDSNVFTDADHSKLDGIESGATADQTAAEIRTLVDSATDSNVFTDADHTKLDGIAAGAEVNVATDLSYTASTRLLASSTGADVTLPEVVASGNSGLITGADKSKLDGIESGATADQTAAEIRTLVDAASDSNVFTDADHTKLDGIAAGAEVNVATNLSYTASSRELASSTGTNVTLPEVSAGGDSGLMTGADKTKLDGLQAGQGSTDLTYTASTRVIASSSGNDATLPNVTAGGDSGLMTGADKTKLDGLSASQIAVLDTSVTVTDTGTDGAITLTADGTSTLTVIDGRTGFGTTSPSKEVHLSKNSTPTLRITNTNNANYDAHFDMEMSNDGTLTFRTNPEDIDSGGALTGHAEFRMSTSSVPTLFMSGTNANVGIGIDNPLAKLHVSSNIGLGQNGGGYHFYDISAGARRSGMRSNNSNDLRFTAVINSSDQDNVTISGTDGHLNALRGLKVTGEVSGDTSEIVIEGVSPQIRFSDSDNYHHWIHINSNNFYVLSDRDSSGGWETPHPLQLESDTNDAYIFGRRIIDNGTFNVDSGGVFNGTVSVTGGLFADTYSKIANRLDVGDLTNPQAEHELRIYKADNNVSDHIQFYNGTTRMGEIGCEDTTWLRINQETAINIYTPRTIRADGGFKVDGDTYGITSGGRIAPLDGTVSNPGVRFGADTNTGFYRTNADRISFATGGGYRGFMSGTNFTYVGIYSSTSSSGSNIRVNSSGRVRRYTSSRDHKTNIEPMDGSYATKILNEAQPVWYRALVPEPCYPQQYLDSLAEGVNPSIDDCESYCLDNEIEWCCEGLHVNEGENPDHSHWGFIAEDLAEVDPRLCDFNPEKGKYDAVNYEVLTPILLKLAQMQKEQITSLEQRIAALESSSAPPQ